MGERVGLRIGRQEWDVWSDVSITLGLESAARSAALAVSTVDFANQRWVDVLPSSPCTVWTGDESSPLITGYIDADDLAIGDGSKIKIETRSKTADLMDCSVVHPTGVFRGQSVEAIAQDLALQYGIRVVCEVDTGDPVPVFRAPPTESVFKALDRLARERGLLLTDNGAGDLVITSIGDVTPAVATLQRGRNIKTLSRRRDVTQRFSEYRVRGQTWDDIGAQAVSTDGWMTRRRILTLDAEKAADQDAVDRRVRWEAATRAGQSIRYEAKVWGWRSDDGALWRPGSFIRLRDGIVNIDDDLLIIRAVLAKSVREGTVATLSLGYAEGYQPEPAKYKAGRRVTGAGTVAV